MSTTESATRPFVISALLESDLERIRAAQADDFGNRLAPRTVDADSVGSPLRCCLREAALGERIVLIAHQPPGGAGPYAEVGPVFIHAQRCAGYNAMRHYPQGFRQRQQVFRAYDATGRICDAVLVEGSGAESALAGLLSRPEVAVVQSRNVLYGCFMFLVSHAVL